MTEEQPVAPDGSGPPTSVDVQLAMLNHYVYTHQNTGPDSEIWKCVAYVEHLARLGALVERMLPGMILEREG